MGPIGWPELVIILVVVLLLFALPSGRAVAAVGHEPCSQTVWIKYASGTMGVFHYGYGD